MMTVRHVSILLYVLRVSMRALTGRRDDDSTARIHFALCASSLDAPPAQHAQRTSSTNQLNQHAQRTRGSRQARGHIKQIRYVPYCHHPPCPPADVWRHSCRSHGRKCIFRRSLSATEKHEGHGRRTPTPNRASRIAIAAERMAR
jgi:hypothetical protein